jgi:hypothetical protein
MPETLVRKVEQASQPCKASPEIFGEEHLTDWAKVGDISSIEAFEYARLSIPFNPSSCPSTQAVRQRLALLHGLC